MVSREEFEAANERAATRLSRTPTVVAAHYERYSGHLVFDLSDGSSITFKPQDFEGLEQASPEQLSEIEILPPGLAVHFPAIDIGIYLPGLLAGLFGSRRWMAALKKIEEKLIEEREEQEWEKLLASPESVAYWEKRSKELSKEHKAGKTIECKPGESEALFQ